VKLSSDLILGFSGSLLSQRYDNPKPTPAFHKELWKFCCSDHPRVAIAAPRGHAKSTAVTHAYVLAEILFRGSDFVVIISATEKQAIRFLNDIKRELSENKALIDLFKVSPVFIKDSEKEIIIEMGHDKVQACITVLGAGGGSGAIRGAKWNNKRPNLIVCDDIETDEEVSSDARREKMISWLYEAVLPSLSDYGKVRIVGTILHFDSLLERLMPPTTGDMSKYTVEKGLMQYSTVSDPDWLSVKFRAHSGFDDFSEILWPEKFSKERLQMVRKGYSEQGFPEGYSQEYLNYPIDEATSFFRREDLVAMDPNDYILPKTYYGAIDLAISTEDKRAYTVIVIGGMDERGILHIVEVIRKRIEADEIINEMLDAQMRYDRQGGLVQFAVEKGAIEKAIGPSLRAEMLRRNVFMNLWIQTPDADKKFRARSIQARMRQGGVRIDKEATWYATFEDEVLKFDKGQYKDQVDAMAWLGLMLNSMVESPTQNDLNEMSWEDEIKRTSDEDYWNSGRSNITGY
jgi:predicted phage terminase large subunit-like protein